MSMRSVEALTGALIAVPDNCRFELLGEGHAGVTVHATTPGGRYNRVIHFVSDEAKRSVDLKSVLATGSRLATQEVDRIDGFTVLSRDYVPKLYTLDDFLRSLRAEWIDPEDVEQKIVSFLLDTLEALHQLHAQGSVHGHLHPKRIGFVGGGSGAESYLVVRGAGVSIGNSEEVLQYAAPEIATQSSKRRRPRRTPDGDVFAFMLIAVELLQKFRDDSGRPRLSSLEASIRWLSDFYFYRRVRPSAAALRTFIDTGVWISDSTAVDDFLDSYSRARKNARKTRLGTLRDSLERFPETRVGIEDKHSRRPLAEWFAIDIRNKKKYYQGVLGKEDLTSQFGTSREFSEDAIPSEMDDLLKDALHRQFYGFPRDADHDDRVVSILANRTASEVEWDLLYENAVADLNQARQALLRDNRFASTREVTRMLEASEPRIGRDELLVLRRWGHVLAVPDHGRWLYPEFQFRHGSVSPLIYDLHQRLRGNRSGSDADAWIELTFWTTPLPALDGSAPKDLLWAQRYSGLLVEEIQSSGM